MSELGSRGRCASRYETALHPIYDGFVSVLRKLCSLELSLLSRGPLENPSNLVWFRPVARWELPEICEDGGLKSCFFVDFTCCTSSRLVERAVT
jgi:hypothetical protein